MLKHAQTSISSESRWHTVAEFSLHGEDGCETSAAERMAELLVSFWAPDQVLLAATQALTRAIEMEMSRLVANPAQRTFTILLRVLGEQEPGVPAAWVGHNEPNLYPKGWGFFLTEKFVKTIEMGNEIHHVVISVCLYPEGFSTHPKGSRI